MGINLIKMWKICTLKTNALLWEIKEDLNKWKNMWCRIIILIIVKLTVFSIESIGLTWPHYKKKNKFFVTNWWTGFKIHIEKYTKALSSVAESYPTLCNFMDCSTPDFPVHHSLLEFAQILVHCVSDAI